MYIALVSLCIACSKNKKPEITSFTTILINETDSSEVHQFNIVATDDKWIKSIKVLQIVRGEVVATFSTQEHASPSSEFEKTFVIEKNATIELKAEVSDNKENVTEKLIQVN